VKWLEAPEIREKYGIISQGAIWSETAASIDAYRLAHQLIHFNVSRGMTVYDHIDFSRLDTSGAEPRMILSTGQEIVAQKIVCCTGFESTKLLKEKIADLFYTYVTISEQGIDLNEEIKKTLIWNTSDPYIYMRTTGDERLLVGGEDSTFNFQFFQEKIKERKASKLASKLEKILPDIDFVEDFSWGGTFGVTKDGLPYIGKSPEYDNTYFVLGFGGNGITFSVQGMDMIVDMLEGRQHPLEEYYRFER
jgi:glycine/D-amino acid oxidase-like deaminating enzyme